MFPFSVVPIFFVVYTIIFRYNSRYLEVPKQTIPRLVDCPSDSFFMPTIRKILPPPSLERRTTSELEAILTRDPVGLTRCDYPKSHSYGWMARVYNGGDVHTRFFADSVYGGGVGALDAAIAWRDEQRASMTPRKRGRTWRLVRVDRPEYKNVGWFAYAEKRRYFSDSVYGGSAGAKTAAEQWLATQLEQSERTVEA